MSEESAEDNSLDRLASDTGVSAADLLSEFYQSLRRMAHRQLRGERADHSLSTTALVNEAWISLAANYPDIRFDNERAFLGLSGQLMRRVLIAHARQLNLLKRGSGQLRVTTYAEGLDAPAVAVVTDELLALDIALTRLQKIDPRQVRLVELRYFAGFSIEETAELMELSPATIKREWAMARAWLIASVREEA